MRERTRRREKKRVIARTARIAFPSPSEKLCRSTTSSKNSRHPQPHAPHHLHSFTFRNNMGFGDRGVIGDKWSSRLLWVCAIGSAIGLYMVAVERQLQNREKMMRAAESSSQSGE